MTDTNNQKLCTLCKTHIDPEMPHRKQKRALPGQAPDPEHDPIVGYIHEWCALRQQLDQMTVALHGANSLAASILSRLGGMVRVHQSDIARAAELGNEMDVTPVEGGFFEVRLKRQIIVSPGIN